MKLDVIPHSWDLTPSAAIAVQAKLAREVRTNKKVTLESIRLIAGLDVSSSKFDPMLTAGAVVWDRLTGDVVETVSARAAATFPYIPGLLSFREIPILLQVLERVTTEPDIFMVDGQGIAHPRGLGIAAHLGVLINRRTIGVAKSRLTGIFNDVGPQAGDSVPLMHHGKRIGVVLRSKDRSNPLFISPGQLIDIDSAEEIVRASFRGYRLPEPTRLAHNFVNEVRRNQTIIS